MIEGIKHTRDTLFRFRNCLSLILITILTINVYGQIKHTDMGFAIGTAHYLGDIGGEEDQVYNYSAKDLQINQTRWDFGVFHRYRASNLIAINSQFHYLRFQGADSESEQPHSRTSRNLSFKNDLLELSSRVEFYFLNVHDMLGNKTFHANFQAYSFIGLGLFYHNPKAQLDGQWHSLKPLTTEGPENEYSLLQPAIPMGFGVFSTFKANKYEKIKRHRIGAEFNLRFTNTDYLDDISTDYPDYEDLPSQLAKDIYAREWELNNDPTRNSVKRPGEGRTRGNPGNKDWYFTVSFTYSYVFKMERNNFQTPKHNYRWKKPKTRGSGSKY